MYTLHLLTGLAVQVTILNESHYQDWNINEFRMMRGDTGQPVSLVQLVKFILVVKGNLSIFWSILSSWSRLSSWTRLFTWSV